MSSAARRLFLSSVSLWVVVALVGIYFLFPIRRALRFGIDLVGGTYMVLEVQVAKAVDGALLARFQGVDALFDARQMVPPTAKKLVGNSIELSFDSTDHATAAAAFLQKTAKDFTVKSQEQSVQLFLSPTTIDAIKREAVDRTIEVLRTRLNPLSVSEIVVAAQGEKNIIVELPDVSDPAQARRMIGKAAVLEFKLVEHVARSEQDILYELDGELPADKEILPAREEGGVVPAYYLVSRYASVTGDLLQRAYPHLNQGKADIIVLFDFSPEGGEKFYDLTSRNIGKQLAIVLDGIVVRAPVIKEGIRHQGSISGGFGAAEAQELSLLLRTGSFKAPVTIVEERQIEPLLGYKAIRQGLLACAMSFVVLFLFNILFYGFAGVLAFIALLYNLLLILVGLALCKATLTLPGIAGIILTIGMAVDSSILIFEQIKEQLLGGSTLQKSVSEGFSDAMAVIVDANITTFIVGVVLYKLGSGPVQGFAVTMMLGIISTLLTGLFFLRSLFTFVQQNFHPRRLHF